MNDKLWRKRSIVGIIILIFGASCIASGASSPTFTTQGFNGHITIDIAEHIAQMKLEQLGKTPDFTITGTDELVSDIDETCIGYVVELSPQGYVVVTADYYLPPVIAYSFTSTFLPDHDAESSLYQLLQADIPLRLENIPSLPGEVIESRHVVWDRYISDEPGQVRTREFQQWPPEGTTPTGGWLWTNWHQNAPYNNFCPIDVFGGGGRSVAGCPAVAMAMIVNYHETINDIVFDDGDDYYHNYQGNRFWIDDDYITYDFPSFPQLNGYLDTLVSHYESGTPLTNDDKAALVFACGVAATQVYHPSGSGTFGVSQAHAAYLRFAFEDIALLDEDDLDLYPRLSNNIKEALPAHLAVVNPPWTMGHNVVVDGYNTDEYYHLNFGWGGPYNGWYLLPDEIPYGLTVVEGCILDIFPPGPDPDKSYVNLTSENHPGLTTCPQRDVSVLGTEIYEHVRVTVKNAIDIPLAGIPKEEFSFTISPGPECHYYDTLSCTFTAVENFTDVNGELEFTVQGDTSIQGNITINVTVMETDINDTDDLWCNSYDQWISVIVPQDGLVGLQDFGKFASDWATGNWESDYNWNGMVELVDFGMFASHWAHHS